MFLFQKNSKRLVWQADSGERSIPKAVSKAEVIKNGMEPDLPHRGTRIPLDDKQAHAKIAVI